MKLTHLDLFSGIGGFALAARWAGIETVQFVELDPFCQKVLAKNFPGVPIHGDITKFHWSIAETERGGRYSTIPIAGSIERHTRESIPPSSGRSEKDFTNKNYPFLLTGGFPCQPFSCAGKRRGKEDDRFLWPQMLRVISEARPTWVIGENVAGFIGMGLDDCVSDLEREGYEVQPIVIPACAVNAPHRRDRVWIVSQNAQDTIDRRNRGWGDGDSGRGECPLQIKGSDRHASDTSNDGLQGGERGGSHEPGKEVTHGAVTKCNNAWSEPWLEVATRLCRVDDGLPRQMDRVNRLKALGNAIVPQVAYEIIKAILTADEVL